VTGVAIQPEGPLGGTVLWRIALSAGVLVGLLIAGAVVRKCGRPLEDRYDETVLEAIQAVAVSIAAVGAAVALVTVWGAGSLIRDRLEVLLFDPRAGLLVLVAGLAVVVAFTLTRITRIFLDERDASIVDSHRREVLQHVIELTIFAVTAMIVLALAGINPRDLLISAGAVGLILGLAARQTLGAVFAGFVLLFSRPFEVGDWVLIDDNSGIVRDVSIFNTTLRTPDDDYVVLPNDKVTTNEIVNRSRMGRYRGSVEVGVDYDADVERAAALADEAMDDLDEVMNRPTPRVVTKRFGDSSVVFELRFWIRNPSAQRLWQAKTAVIRAVKTAFDDEDVTIPYPQRELSARPGAAIGGADPGADAAPEDGERPAPGDDD